MRVEVLEWSISRRSLAKQPVARAALVVGIAARPAEISGFCSTMHERASSFLEGSEGFFRRNGRKYFDIVEWIFRFGW